MNFLKNIFLFLTHLLLTHAALTKVKAFKPLPFATAFFLLIFCTNSFATTLCKEPFSKVPKDFLITIETFGKGAVKGIPNAQKHTELFAEQGYSMAKFWLGEMFSHKKDFRNIEIAEKWYKEAAEQFKTEVEQEEAEQEESPQIWYALLYLGKMYGEGKGVKKDPEQARYWYDRFLKTFPIPLFSSALIQIRKIAEEGDRNAQYVIDEILKEKTDQQNPAKTIAPHLVPAPVPTPIPTPISTPIPASAPMK